MLVADDSNEARSKRHGGALDLAAYARSEFFVLVWLQQDNGADLKCLEQMILEGWLLPVRIVATREVCEVVIPFKHPTCHSYRYIIMLELGDAIDC